MPGKEWNDDDVKAEIAAAVAIVREDKFEAFVRNRIGASPSDQNGGKDQSGNSGNGNGNDPTAPKKSKSIFWGDTE